VPGVRVAEGEEKNGVLKHYFLSRITFPRIVHGRSEGEREARLSDVFLESPTVGLLGLRIFELPAVGLPEFNQHLLGSARVEFGEEGL
jgi:hypothetical protein